MFSVNVRGMAGPDYTCADLFLNSSASICRGVFIPLGWGGGGVRGQGRGLGARVAVVVMVTWAQFPPVARGLKCQSRCAFEAISQQISVSPYHSNQASAPFEKHIVHIGGPPPPSFTPTHATPPPTLPFHPPPLLPPFRCP